MSAVRGWCPGALRPMMTGDGLIVRLRVIGGVISPVLAHALAELSRRYGNGLIDLSSRANLQLRGVREDQLSDLQDALGALDLLGKNSAIEAIRNVISSPLAGVDETAVLDIRPLVRRLDRVLQEDPALRGLPGKFGFAIDDGGAVPLDDTSADIKFEAYRSVRREPRFAVSLAGMPVASCNAESLPHVAVTLAHAFISLRRDENRLKTLIGRLGFAAILWEAEMPFEPVVLTARPRLVLGNHDSFLSVGLEFGRMTADAFDLLASMAESVGGDLGLTPFRTILITKLAAGYPAQLALKQAGFILDETDPLRAIAACPGAPACRSATTSVHDDARTLNALLGRFVPTGIGLHISGCDKGCAHPTKSPVTLVGNNGRYDLVIDGTAQDTAIMYDLDVHQAAAILCQLETGRSNG